MTPDDDRERQRLHILQLYQIMDSAAEKAFDDLTALAAVLCDAPISLVSLVDDRRQWFKARVGLDASHTPREHAFCAHAIHDDRIMVVEDALLDTRFIDNPLVTGEPNIRFYAGAPLRVGGGHALGTLCVIDRKPRQLTTAQLNALSVLRDAVVAQLELRRAIHDFQTLQTVLPICAWCRKVKIEPTQASSETWVPLYDYLCNHATVSHAICPACYEIHMEDQGDVP